MRDSSARLPAVPLFIYEALEDVARGSWQGILAPLAVLAPTAGDRRGEKRRGVLARLALAAAR